MLRSDRRRPSGTPGHSYSTSSSAHPTNAMRRKRKDTKEADCLLKLERVLGLTSNKPMILSVNPTQDLVAYAAGCVVVLYNHKLNKQVGLLCSSTLKKQPPPDSTSGPGSARSANATPWGSNSFAGANFNPMGGLMPMSSQDPSNPGASGPGGNKGVKPKPVSCLTFSPDGHFLAIGETGHQPRILIIDVATQLLVTELHGHTFGVQALCFSPNSKLLVSLGFQIASNKITTKVNALAFAADGSFFVTAGLRLVKFWYLNDAPKRGVTGNNAQTLEGRAGLLGDHRNGNYVDVVCSPDGRRTYVISSSGLLCLFDENRAMEKWINLQTRGAYSVNLTEKAVICACTDGIIRLFEPETLEYIASVPKPPPVGAIEESTEEDVQEGDRPNVIYADVLASQYDASSSSLVCVYSDRSLLVWDLTDQSQAVMKRNHIFHSDSIWGVEVVPPVSADREAPHQFPPNTFLTYSSDGSIKFWNLDETCSLLPPTTTDDSEQAAEKSNGEVLRILYADENCRSFIQAPENQDGTEPGFNLVPLECGVRTIRISHDGRYLASGDKAGNLRVHSMSTFQQVTYQEAHDTEILAIDFTDPSDQESPYLVATAGRDRLLHVFDVLNDYALVQTLDDHSSSITCIRFTADGSRMMSCGADKSIVFRNCQKNQDGMSFHPYHQAPGRATFYDMGLHNSSQTISVVAGDRRFNVFTLDTGKPIKSFKAEPKVDDQAASMMEICSMTHIDLDPSGTIAVASGSDKSIRVYDLLNGTCLSHAICHSELVTNVKFMNTYDRVISTSADGCVLVWRLASDITKRIQNRIHENITLPGHLKAKAAEKSLAPSATASVPAQKTTVRKRPTEKSVNVRTGASRRDSNASIMSEDNDLRSASTRTKDHRSDDVSKGDFSPVTVKQASSPRTPAAARSRVTASVSKTPAARPRQNSVSHPQPPKPHPAPPAPTRSGTALHGTSQKSKSVVKEKVPSAPLTVKTSTSVPTGNRLSDTADKQRLAVPSKARSRATSLTEPTKETLRMDRATAKTKPETKQALSDHSQQDPSSAVEDQEDESSDEAKSSLKGIGTPSLSPTAISNDAVQPPHESEQGTSEAELGDENDGSDGSNGDDELADDIGGSEGRDSDDMDEDDSISEAGSDTDMLSHAVRRNVGPGALQDLGLSESGSFEEGERVRDSPLSERGYPSSRVASITAFASNRRSLSARFLAAHAASVMLDMLQDVRQGHLGASKSHLNQTRTAEDGGETTSGAGQGPNEEQNRQDGHERPLEERLNLKSLNSMAYKWKQKALGTTPETAGQNEGVEQGTKTPESGHSRSATKTDDYHKEVERTRKRLAELGYISTTGATLDSASSVVATSPEAVPAKTTDLGEDGPGSEPSSVAPLDKTDQRGRETASPTVLDMPGGPKAQPQDSLTLTEKGPPPVSEPQASKIKAEDEGERKLQEAIERISHLISQRAKSDKSGATVDAEQLQMTKKWMRETRENLLNLVGEVQGHLWELERH
ncbi:MAG: hypothetical protein J3Q66DRAFT_375561 [Benniella sp.]|nr:MAG: hypothetical protein J3Q66DRAFT_375561 [Benniella sp.]